jgi:hypothetical protein
MLAIFAAVIVLLATLAMALKAVYAPDIHLLVSTGGAEWIVRRQTPVWLGTYNAGESSALFGASFTTDRPIENASIDVRAMRDAQVYLDERLVASYRGDFKEWKKTRNVLLARELPPGKHEIILKVANKNGYPALLAFSDALHIHTGRGWATSLDGNVWKQAEYADVPLLPDITYKFTPVGEAFVSNLKYLLPVFPVVFFLAYNFGAIGKRFPAAVIGPSAVRWLLMAAWIVLAANNIFKIPLNLGYDYQGHYDYIFYVYDNWRIPFADQGWQMHQPPLYYFLSAGLIAVLDIVVDRHNGLALLRLVSYACVLVQVEVCYRAMKHVFASRPDIQVFGLVVGGLLPMNLYIGQFIGNELPAGVLSSIFVIMSFRFFGGVRLFDAVAAPQFDAVAAPQLDAVAAPQRASEGVQPHASDGDRPRWYIAVAGVVLGLALLTKVTAVVLVLPLALMLAYAAASRRSVARGMPQLDAVAAPQLDAVAAPQLDAVAAPQPASRGVRPPASKGVRPPASKGVRPPASKGVRPPASRGFISSASVAAATAFIVSGWYYILVWLKFGIPFIGGWDPSLGISWWQNPAYRMPVDFLRFGRSLLRPVYGSMEGLWDGLYSTFWMDGNLSGVFSFGDRPPWNYDLMFASLPFTVILTAGIFAGIVSILSAPQRNINNGKLLSVIYILFFVAAVAYRFLTVPTFSTAKATYMTGITPCFAIALAAGVELIANRRILYATAAAVVSCWAIFNYLSYFVVGG